MKSHYKLYILFYILIFAVGISAANAQNQLHGSITDVSGGTTLTGANVFPDLKLGVNSDTNGAYSIKNIPSGTYIVEVRFLGYATFTQTISITGDKEQNFALTPSAMRARRLSLMETL